MNVPLAYIRYAPGNNGRLSSLMFVSKPLCHVKKVNERFSNCFKIDEQLLQKSCFAKFEFGGIILFYKNDA